MKPADLANIPTIVQTKAIAAATADPETMLYVQMCLSRCFAGDYGSICADDVESNNAELEAGEGRILAAYPQQYKLTDKIWIIAYSAKVTRTAWTITTLPYFIRMNTDGPKLYYF